MPQIQQVNQLLQIKNLTTKFTSCSRIQS